MTANPTFAKKLQAAVKAKIQELGVDADDELAEYVMILAANKKEKDQIKKELHLFLGKNTGCFVDWLFAAFERIQKTLAERKHPDKSTSKNDALKVSGKNVDKTNKHALKEDKTAKEARSSKSQRSENSSKRHENPPKSKSSEKRRDSSSPPTKKHTQNGSSKLSRHEKSPKSEQSSRHKKPSSSKHDKSPKHEKGKESSRSEQHKEEPKKRKHEKSRHDEKSAVQVSDSEDEKSLKSYSTKRAKKERTPEKHSKRPKIQETSSPKHVRSHRRSSENDKHRVDRSPSGSNHKKRSSKRTHSISPDQHLEEDTKKLILNLQEIEERSDGQSNDSTPAALTHVWDGRITIDEDSSEDDAEAQIDALLEGLDELIDTIPETSILSGPNLSAHLIQTPSPAQTPSQTPPETSTNTKMESAPKKLVERCRFWPGCDKNEQCTFHHPVEVCAVFPNCPFGDRCLNIHPLCKFNKKCRKPRCPFTHDLKGVATVVLYPHDVAAAQKASLTAPSRPPVQPSNSGLCRFKGRCAVPNCKFTHPPACRFGLRCQNPSCTFSHRKPDFTKFQWVSNNQQ